jgi:hypothetical protein
VKMRWSAREVLAPGSRVPAGVEVGKKGVKGEDAEARRVFLRIYILLVSLIFSVLLKLFLFLLSSKKCKSRKSINENSMKKFNW